jgi:5'-methylthioadenosine phosphorylase
MSRLGLIVGSAMFGAEPLPPGDVVVLQRHGTGDYLPPQRIDHAANIRSLAAHGCERVLAICSVGSLREEIGVGSFLCPDDFVALHLGGSAFTDERGHLVAGFDPGWRSRLLGAWERSAGEPLGDAGTYWQAVGPRFETPAEIRLIAPHADVVGMTLASECIVACELGLPFAAICAVDNLANGVGGPLSAEEFEAGQSANRARLEALVPALVAELGAEDAA